MKINDDGVAGVTWVYLLFLFLKLDYNPVSIIS